MEVRVFPKASRGCVESSYFDAPGDDHKRNAGPQDLRLSEMIDVFLTAEFCTALDCSPLSFARLWNGITRNPQEILP